MGLSAATDIPLEPRKADSVVPLTALQRRCWASAVARMSESRMGGASMRIFGPLNIALLRTSIDAIVRRHESLRTRIVEVDGILRQQIDAPYGCDLQLTDVSGGSPGKICEEAERLAEEFICEKVDLSAGPLFAARILRLSEHEHLLMLGVDHIVTDGASCGIIRKEIWTAYRQAVQGLPLALPNVPVQFGDYAVWQQRTYEGWRRTHELYWVQRLTGAPQLELPFDGGTPGTHLTWTMTELPFGNQVSKKLRDAAWREREPLSLVVFTILVAVISHWCCQRDFIVTFVSHGRHGRPLLANTTGLVANFLHLRIQIAERDNFMDLLRHVALEFRTAIEHQDFDRVPELMPEITRPIQFNWSPTTWTRRSAAPSAETNHPVNVQWFPVAKFRGALQSTWRKLAFAVWPGDDDTSNGIVVNVRHQTGLISPTLLDRFNRSLQEFAEGFADRPLTPIASLQFALN